MASNAHPPANRCIYCGSLVYARDSKRLLAEEHIIPLGLNGTDVLPRASCRHCERVTGRLESKVLRGALLGCRTILNLQTRSPKERPKTLPLFYTVEGVERKAEIPIEDYPATLLLLRLGKPGIFRNPEDGPPVWHPWHHLFVDRMEVLRRHYGITEFSPAMFDTSAFSRMLAKIAHAFVAANMGMDSFTPLLPRLILDDSGSDLAGQNLLHMVGGEAEIRPPQDLLHWMQFEDPTPETLPFIVVQIRLFAFLGSPTYRIVVGRRLRLADASVVA